MERLSHRATVDAAIHGHDSQAPSEAVAIRAHASERLQLPQTPCTHRRHPGLANSDLVRRSRSSCAGFKAVRRSLPRGRIAFTALLSTEVARAISSTWRSPITPRAGGNRSAYSTTYSRRPGVGRRCNPATSSGLPPGLGVIALREVVEMARTTASHDRTAADHGVVPISETCLPGEGRGVGRSPTVVPVLSVLGRILAP